MSPIGVVVYRQSPLRPQVLQESVNNSVNIANNDLNKSGRREIIIVKKKQKLQSPPSAVSVTTLVRAPETTASSAAKRTRIKEDGSEEQVRTPTPLAVARRNARERNRVRQVNDGFAALRQHIPEEVAAVFENVNSNRGPNKKLSKVETLRMAVEYIRNLESLLNIGHSLDKENGSRPSMESFPSPASSSPRDTSQERSYFSINSPGMEDDDLDEDELDNSLSHLPSQQYMGLPGPDSLQLVSTPHLYDEDDGGGPPLTPSSDLLMHEDVNTHLIGGNFQFPNTAEQFSVIPEQNYNSESEIISNENEFEVKYSQSQHSQMISEYSHGVDIPLDAINSELILMHNQYKFKEDDEYPDNHNFAEVELKKELPDIHVTPEDREQFEETLKWWQEKTQLARPIINIKKD